MKNKTIMIFMAASIVLALCGCNEKNIEVEPTETVFTETVEDIGTEPSIDIKEEEPKEEVDIDLSEDDESYITISEYVVDPIDHIGEKIRVSGYTFTEDGRHILLVATPDGLSRQEVEYVLEDEEEYPEDGYTGIVSGTLDMYTVNQTDNKTVSYLYIKNAKLEWCGISEEDIVIEVEPEEECDKSNN